MNWETSTSKTRSDSRFAGRNGGLRLSCSLLGSWSLFFALFLGTILMAGAAQNGLVLSTNLPPISPAFPDASFSVIRVFGALLLVLALFLGGVWVFKNWQRLTLHRGRPSQLQILETKALGGKHALYVVGYQQQRLLLASSPNGVALVSHLPSADPADLAPNTMAGPISGDNFVQVLQQAVQGKA
jgi:flagellar biogenesis protein FliO